MRDRPGPTWVTWFWLAVFGVFFLRSCDFLDNDAKTNIADGGPAQSYEQLAGSAADETVPQPANEPDIPILADLPSVQTSSDLYVVISNNTGYPIQQVFISPDDASSWEEDRLEGRILNHGESIRFNLTGHRNPMFDIQLVDADGDTYSFHDVDVERYDVTATIANLDP